MTLESNWRPSNHYPDLSSADVLSVDLETYDPGLLERGPGGVRKEGYVIGFSVATGDGFRGYYPIRHPENNVDNPQAAVRWFKDVCGLPAPKIGANIIYDMEWAKCDLGIDIKGVKYDVQVAEPLLDENRQSFRLDSLGVSYCNEHKDEQMLYDAGIEILKIKPAKDDSFDSVIKKVKGLLWKLPARFVGPYGEQDADLPIKVFNKQKVLLEEQGLWPLFLLEAEVLDLLFEMRMMGVRVDVEKAKEARDMLGAELVIAQNKLHNMSGGSIDIWSAESIGQACDKLGLGYDKTAKGNKSFKADWLKDQEHPFFKALLEARSLDRSGSVFIEDKILKLAVNGRIHPQFSQVKNDRGGTVSGRFSSQNPNAQQFPSRNERIASIVRGLIIPEEGCHLASADYSQQEPRVTIHYAYVSGLPAGDTARQQFIDNPRTDYHQMVADMANIKRKSAKAINLGLVYGMGKKKLAAELGLSLSEAYAVFDQYHSTLPYVKLLSEKASRTADARGYIKTLLGRRGHFDLFGPMRWTDGIVPKKYDEAVKEFGLPVTRYFLHKVLNRLIQGSSADMIKVAMVLCRRAGYIPHMTVHDENVYSVRNLKEASEIQRIMVKDTAEYLGLTVPLVVDTEIGKSWGSGVSYFDHCKYNTQLVEQYMRGEG